jgi:hypothetical protein
MLSLSSQLFANEISYDIHEQLNETKRLLENNRTLKARESLDYILFWFEDELSPIELQLVKYFQGKVYLLDKKYSLSIASFENVYESKILDQDILEEVRRELGKLNFITENFLTALYYLEKEEDSEEILKMKYGSNLALKNFKKAYLNLYNLAQISPDITIWSEFINFSKRLDISLYSLKISNLLKKIERREQFLEFFSLFSKEELFAQILELSQFAVQKEFLTSSDSEIIDFTIDTFFKLMNFPKTARFISDILKIDGIDKNRYSVKLAKAYIEIGEFELAYNTLDNLPEIGEKYLLFGDLAFLEKRYFDARENWFKAFRFLDCRKEASAKLENIKKLLKD